MIFIFLKKKNEYEGANFFLCQIFLKQNLVWRKYGHHSLNKNFEAGVKKLMRQCREKQINLHARKYKAILQ